MSSRSYPIWNSVEACIYKSGKSWGAKDCSDVDVLVGSSSSNSHHFVNHTTRKIITEDHVIFKFYVDGNKVKEMIFENKGDRAGILIEEKKFDLVW